MREKCIRCQCNVRADDFGDTVRCPCISPCKAAGLDQEILSGIRAGTIFGHRGDHSNDSAPAADNLSVIGNQTEAVKGQGRADRRRKFQIKLKILCARIFAVIDCVRATLTLIFALYSKGAFRTK